MKENDKNKSKKSKVLKSCVAMTLGLSMAFSIPHVVNLVDLVKIGNDTAVTNVLNKTPNLSNRPKQTTLDNFGYKDTTINGNTNTTNPGAANVTKSGLVEGELPQGYEGNWLDQFKVDGKLKTQDELLALTHAEGNIFKDADDNNITTNKYEISNATEFAFLSAYANTIKNYNDKKDKINNKSEFVLTANIDLAGKAWTPVFNFYYSQDIVLNFNGQGNTISHVYINNVYDGKASVDDDYSSIFGSWPGGTISNLTVENSLVRSWSNAALITYRLYNYTRKINFEKVVAKNSKVYAGGRDVYGLTSYSESMVDCYMENCEVIATNSDESLNKKSTDFKEGITGNGEQFLVDNAFNSDRKQYVAGFGRVSNVTKSADEGAKTGLYNCKVAFESNLNGYKQLTNSKDKTVYVSGISFWDYSTSEGLFNDIEIKNSLICTDVNIGAAEKAKEDKNTYNKNFNSYVTGVVWGNFKENKVEFENVKVTDSTIYSKATHDATSPNNKDVMYTHRGYVNGIGSINSTDGVVGVKYTNSSVTGTTITSEINSHNTNAMSKPSTSSSSPVLYNYAYLGGIATVRANNTSFEGCTLENSNLYSHNNFNNENDDTSYYAYCRAFVSGIGENNESGYVPTYTNCEVLNSNLKAENFIDNGEKTDPSKDDYLNHYYNNVKAMGIGAGQFIECTVKRSNIYAKGTSEILRKEGLESNGSIGGEVLALGLGFLPYKESGIVDHSKVTNSTIESSSNWNSAFTCGLAYGTYSSEAKGHHIHDSNLEKVTLKAESLRGTNYISGLLNNYAVHIKGSEQLLIENNKVNDVKIVGDAGQSESYTSFGVINRNKVNNKIVMKNNDFTNVDAQFVRNDSELPNDMQKAFGNTYHGSALVNTSYATFDVSNTTVKNAVINCDIKEDKVKDDVYNYLSGLVYNTSSYEAGAVNTLTSNTTENLKITNKFMSSTYGYGSLRSMGMLYNSSSASVTVEDCEVSNSTISTYSNVAEQYSAGLALNTSNVDTKYNNCYAYNNKVTSTFEKGGSNAARTITAFGMVGGLNGSISNSAVGSGIVHAFNEVADAGAYGIGNLRGYTTYSARANTVDDTHSRYTNCYNFAEVHAQTGSNKSLGYAAGMGIGEEYRGCANYGKITGNIVGGIALGFWTTSVIHNNTQYSFKVNMKNCINNGNLYRNDIGGTSYIGGLLGYYRMSYTAFSELVLENNISNGNLYSNQAGTEQELSNATYLGMLYGYVASALDSNGKVIPWSIKNNYMNVNETNNKNLVYDKDVVKTANIELGKEVNSKLEGLKGKVNTPYTNFVSTREGVYSYSNWNETDNLRKLAEQFYDTNSFGNETTKNTNISLNATYTVENLNEKSEENPEWNQFKMYKGGLPQNETTGLNRKIVHYDLGDLVGTTPNVQFVKLKVDKYEFTTSEGQILTETGKNVASWKFGEDDKNSHATGAKITDNDNLNEILLLTAEAGYIEYTFVFDGSSSAEVEVKADTDGQIFALNDLKGTITAKYTGTTSTVNTYKFEVKNEKTDKWELFKTKSAQDKTATINIEEFINTEFLAKYANSSNQITVRAIIDGQTLHKVTVTEKGTTNYKISVTSGGVDALTNQVINGSELKVAITVDPFYELTALTIGGVSQELNQTNWTIEKIEQATDIEVTVQKKQYAINVELQNLQGVTLDKELTSTLIENGKTMEVDSKLPAVKAKTDVKGYRFVGWKLSGMNSYITDEKGTIETTQGYMVKEADFARYLTGPKGSEQFNLIAVFQRQYSIDVMMNNTFGDNFASEFEVNYVDENGEEKVYSNKQVVIDRIPDPDNEGEFIEKENIIYNQSASYLIDENTFVQVKIKPNKRVKVQTPVNEQFGNNVYYVYLTGNKTINVNFEIKPIDIFMGVIDVQKPSDNEITESTVVVNHLTPMINYKVTHEKGGQGTQNDTKVLNINDVVNFAYDKDSLTKFQYRFVEMRLMNYKTGEYEVIQTGVDIKVNDDFFDKYVNDLGQIDISMKAIKQFKVNISGENETTADKFDLGNFTCKIIDEEGNEVIPNENERCDQADESKTEFVLDNGLRIELIANVTNKYAEFSGFKGLFDGELTTDANKAVITANDNREVSLRFDKSVFTVKADVAAGVGGLLDYTKQFSLGDTIQVSYTPKNNYEILDWKIGGKTLSELGANKNGNTVSIKVTKELLDAMTASNAFGDDQLTLNNNIDTMMARTLFYGIIGGGAAILVLFGTTLFLILRSVKLKKQKEENEKKLNDIARKFNIADMIKDLKDGK